MFVRGEEMTKVSSPLPAAAAPPSAPRRDRSRTPARLPYPKVVAGPGSRALSRGGVPADTHSSRLTCRLIDIAGES
eukprot:12888072-Prorocentrum_lima.AAC.1